MQEEERQEGKLKIQAPPHASPGMAPKQSASFTWRGVEVQPLPK